MATGNDGALTPVHVRKGGEFYRVADQDWTDPLDTGYTKRRGGRWNAPGSFGVLYLSENVATARDFVRHLHAGRPYGPEDLGHPPLLVVVNVPEEDYTDAHSETGLQVLGLPLSYPRTAPAAGDIVPYERCQPIGKQLFDAGELGIACRSANAPDGAGAELAWFDQAGRTGPALTGSRTFEEWYWDTRGS